MKVTQHIENAKGKPLFSFEILPPLKGQNIQSIFDGIDPLMEFNPPFIDVTYHREEYEFKELPNGLLQKKIVKNVPERLEFVSEFKINMKSMLFRIFFVADLPKKILRID